MPSYEMYKCSVILRNANQLILCNPMKCMKHVTCTPPTWHVTNTPGKPVAIMVAVCERNCLAKRGAMQAFPLTTYTHVTLDLATP